MNDSALTPPQAIEAEQTILGALLLWPESFDNIESLSPEDFYRAEHRVIFATIRDMIEQGAPVDAITVADRMNSDESQRGYLGTLASRALSPANIRRHADIVRDRAQLRGLAVLGNELTQAAYHAEGKSAHELLQEGEAKLLRLLEPTARFEFVSLGRAALAAIDARDEPSRALPTGLRNLDARLKGGGAAPGQVVVVAGRSSMGKSALLQQIAENIGRSNTVAYFTLEMSARELADRALRYHESRIGLSEAAAHLASLRVEIDETPAVTLAHIRLRCRRIQRRKGLALIVVDYLQLMQGHGENRTQEIGSLTRGLKAIAKEFSVPVLLGAQINRGVEGRTDRRPMMADLRESGDIEADADVILMLYRDEYYHPDTPAKGLAEIIVRKQRNGPVGMVPVRFEAEVTRFSDFEGEIPQPSFRRSGTVSTVDFKAKAAGEREQ